MFTETPTLTYYTIYNGQVIQISYLFIGHSSLSTWQRCRRMHLPTLIRKAFIGYRWWLPQTNTTRQGAENKCPQNTQSQMENLYCTLSLKGSRKRGQKDNKTQKCEWIQENSVLQTQPGSCTMNSQQLRLQTIPVQSHYGEER